MPWWDTDDHYKVLQVDPDAEQIVIDGAYKRLAARYHPDVNKEPNAGEVMKRINAAYEVLRDPRRRQDYDDTRQRSRTWTPPLRRDPGNVSSPYNTYQRPHSLFGRILETIISAEISSQLLIAGIILLIAVGLFMGAAAILPKPSSPQPPPNTTSEALRPTPVATLLPAPRTLGIGEQVEAEGLSIEIADYQYRSVQDRTTIGELEITFRFGNATTNRAGVRFDTSAFRVRDNRGIELTDNIVLAKSFWQARNCGRLIPENFPTTWEFEITPYTSALLTLVFTRDKEERTCRNPYKNTSRVDLQTNYIEVEMRGVSYRTAAYNEFTTPPVWRLDRR